MYEYRIKIKQAIPRDLITSPIFIYLMYAEKRWEYLSYNPAKKKQIVVHNRATENVEVFTGIEAVKEIMGVIGKESFLPLLPYLDLSTAVIAELGEIVLKEPIIAVQGSTEFRTKLFSLYSHKEKFISGLNGLLDCQIIAFEDGKLGVIGHGLPYGFFPELTKEKVKIVDMDTFFDHIKKHYPPKTSGKKIMVCKGSPQLKNAVDALKENYDFKNWWNISIMSSTDYFYWDTNERKIKRCTYTSPDVTNASKEHYYVCNPSDLEFITTDRFVKFIKASYSLNPEPTVEKAKIETDILSYTKTEPYEVKKNIHLIPKKTKSNNRIILIKNNF